MDPLAFTRELRRVSDTPQVSEVMSLFYTYCAATDDYIWKNTCESSFAAIERANSRVNKGFAVTGVVGVIDSRHGILLPNRYGRSAKGRKVRTPSFIILL